MYVSVVYIYTVVFTYQSIKMEILNQIQFIRSHKKCSLKSGVLKNFAKFTRKHLCQILFFDKVAGSGCKKRLWHRCFSCEFCKIFKHTFFTEHLWTTASPSPLNIYVENVLAIIIFISFILIRKRFFEIIIISYFPKRFWEVLEEEKLLRWRLLEDQ